jgi:hypothetical protein
VKLDVLVVEKPKAFVHEVETDKIHSQDAEQNNCQQAV